LPPFKVGPPEEIPRAAASAPVFVSPKKPSRPPPPPPHMDEEEDEFEYKSSSSSGVAWAVGGFLAAAALAVIAYFTLLPSAPPKPPEPAKVPPPPLVAIPPPPPPLPPELPPAPSSSKATAKTKSPAKTQSAPPVASAAPAKVNIQADMPLDISFKGKRIGKTPAQVSLPAGNVTLLFSNKSAGIRTKRSLELKPDQTVHLNVQLGKGTLNVNAPAGAHIRVNGVLKGRAPMGDIELWEGEHRLSVEHNNQTLSESFSLAPGGYMNYDVTETR